MNNDINAIKKELKHLLVEHLALEDITAEEIGDDMPLFGEGVGLDSLDGVEVVVLLQRHYGLDVKDMQKGREIFQSVNTLADYIIKNRQNK